MSYALAVAGDARADLAAMETWLQEEFWDEFERLAADPSILPVPSLGDDITYQFVRDAVGFRHIVRLTIGRNDVGKRLTVLGVTYEERPLDG